MQKIICCNRSQLIYKDLSRSVYISIFCRNENSPSPLIRGFHMVNSSNFLQQETDETRSRSRFRKRGEKNSFRIFSPRVRDRVSLPGFVFSFDCILLRYSYCKRLQFAKHKVEVKSPQGTMAACGNLQKG